jgi:hypothetical protein
VTERLLFILKKNLLALSFNANLAALSNRTHFQKYEKMSAEVRFVLDKPQKTINLIVKKNNHRMELNGQARNGEIELKLSTSLKGFENVMVTCRYDLASLAN